MLLLHFLRIFGGGFALLSGIQTCLFLIVYYLFKQLLIGELKELLILRLLRFLLQAGAYHRHRLVVLM